MLPGYDVCNECGGSGTITIPGAGEIGYLKGLREEPCHVCSGAGSVPGDATVDALAEAIYAADPRAPLDRWEDGPEAMKYWYRQQARAALVAYAQTVKEN